MALITVPFKTPWGFIEVTHDEQHIHKAIFTNTSNTDFSNSNHTNFNQNNFDFKNTKYTDPCITKHTDSNILYKTILHELQQYFSNAWHRFQLPLKPIGTVFQQRVWNALLVIPAGRTLSYGQLARQLQTSPRAVGQACKTNAIALFIPCHRVVAKDHIGGFMGKESKISLKKSLLLHEQAKNTHL